MIIIGYQGIGKSTLAGRFAYAVKYSQTLMDDVLRWNMEPVSKAGKYV